MDCSRIQALNLWTAARGQPQAVDCAGIVLETEITTHARWRPALSARRIRAAQCPDIALNAAIVFVIATVDLPSLLLTATMGAAGFLGGVIAPSRDMLVRNAAPAGAAGRAFGIVSTGFNLGGIVSPLLFGWIMDQNLPHWVFGASAVFMVLTVLLALVTDRSPQACSDEPDARLMQP